jgi:hypothetical protein
MLYLKKTFMDTDDYYKQKKLAVISLVMCSSTQWGSIYFFKAVMELTDSCWITQFNILPYITIVSGIIFLIIKYINPIKIKT